MVAPPPAPDATNGPRDRLLSAAIDYAEQHGVAELRLRDVADAIGTSHRMLIYHFGSKEGLLVAIVQAVETAQRNVLRELGQDPTIGPAEAIATMWARLADPALAAQERLFFEIYAQALQGRPGTEGFLDGIVGAWVEVAVESAAALGLDPATARADARLGVAVIRGLLLDLLATGDRTAVDQAADRYADLYRPSPDRHP